MEHKSSFNLQRGSRNSFYHIFRHSDHKAATIIKEYSKNNIYTISANVEEMLKEWQDDYNKYCDYKIENKEKGGKKISKNNTLMEIVVNVKSTTTADEMKEIEKYYEKELSIKIYGSAIHRDEGERDPDDNNKIKRINHHAHIIAYTIKDNKQMFRRQHITQKKLREMQTRTAEILQMKRGRDARETKAKHKHYKQFKADAEKEKELLKELENKDLNTIINKCKSYANKNKTLMSNISLDTLDTILNYVKKQTPLKYNFREMQKKITALENIDKEQKKELHRLNTQANKDNSKIAALTAKLDMQIKVNKEFANNNTELETENKELKQDLQEATKTLKTARDEIVRLEKEKQLERETDELLARLDEKEKERNKDIFKSNNSSSYSSYRSR